MKFIRGLYNLSPEQKGCVVTIGNFDGMHCGHIELLKKLNAKAEQLQLPATVIIFEPQPNEYFGGAKTPPRLMRLREKLSVLQAQGVQQVLCLRFDKTLAALSAEQFVEQILIAGLQIKHLIIGDDFRFGYQRLGDFELLQRYAMSHNFTVDKIHTFLMQDERVSSSRVRRALEVGDLKIAEYLLGRPFTLSGRVAHGDKRGRIIGFPTANIYLHRKAVPIAGVYVVKMHGITRAGLPGVANVGTRPTVGGTRSLLEVHLFDFNRDIYGRHVEVEFIKKLRDEKRYDSFELLKEQIFKDAAQARQFFMLD
jgi:riboflavin kinase/FMN adenylyltransferase